MRMLTTGGGWPIANVLLRRYPLSQITSSGSITDRIGSGIPTFQPFPLFLNIIRCRPCIHSLFTFRGSFPSLSPCSGILLCPDLPWRTNTWYKGRVGEDVSRIRHRLPLSVSPLELVYFGRKRQPYWARLKVLARFQMNGSVQC